MSHILDTISKWNNKELIKEELTMQSKFNELSAKRRSIYALGDNITTSPDEFFNLVKETVRNSPSAFNPNCPCSCSVW